MNRCVCVCVCVCVCDITAMQYGILLKYYTKAEIMLIERGGGGRVGEHRMIQYTQTIK